MQLKRIDKTEDMTVDYAFLLLLKVLHGFEIFRRRDVVYGLPMDAFNVDDLSGCMTTNLERCCGCWSRALKRAEELGFVDLGLCGWWSTTPQGRRFSDLVNRLNLVELVDFLFVPNKTKA